MTLDDHDLFTPTTAANPAASPKVCRRHVWEPFASSSGSVSQRCGRCGRWRDEAIVRRNRGNRQRGASFERTVAKKLGGRRTGPLGGRDDVIVGSLFSIQTKRAARFSLNEARTYLDDQRRAFPDRVPLVVHALPGERGGVVVVSLEDWIALHGKDGGQP